MAAAPARFFVVAAEPARFVAAAVGGTGVYSRVPVHFLTGM
jgi:hypothetical protein